MLATLAGGCFWCLEAVYERLDGVESVDSGYAGGTAPNPTYEEVCSGTSGHAEVVQVRFDPAKVSYRDILKVFFSTHDPTTLNRQGPDVGTQYRSAIFWHDETQRNEAKALIEELEREHVFGDPIVTEVAPLTRFYPAEQYHKDYYRRNSQQPYCTFVIAPKLAKFRKEFGAKLKDRQGAL